MSPRALGLTFAATWTLCVVDQIDGDVAAIELAESQLIALPAAGSPRRGALGGPPGAPRRRRAACARLPLPAPSPSR